MEEKKSIAKRPPMGWNSWDCFGAAVTEKDLLENAEYMAKHLKSFGWEYVVCDIQWYEPHADSHEYHKFTELTMDEYSRLMPAVERFPSAEGGKGFGPIADRIHDMGLKFGIHIMRGIPRQAVHGNMPILGTSATARDIAHPSSVCKWNTDMYGVESSTLLTFHIEMSLSNFDCLNILFIFVTLLTSHFDMSPLNLEP